MFCCFCGQQLQENIKFCPNCGTKGNVIVHIICFNLEKKPNNLLDC